jgi:hypothetical protein
LAKRSKYTLTWGFTLSFLSVFLCWFFGLPGLALGILGLRKVLPYKSNMKSKGSKGFKAKYGFRLAIAGIALSSLFTIYYIVALANGAFIRW